MQRISYCIKTTTRYAKRQLSQITDKLRCDRQPTNRSTLSYRLKTPKQFIQLSSIALLSLPAKGLIPTPVEVAAYDRVMLQNILTIASSPGDSTYFATDNFQHGFGYDLARSYANELNVSLNLVAYPTDAEALAAVKRGEADLALTTLSTKTILQSDMASMPLSCGQDAKLTQNGLHPKVSWSFATANDPLSKQASRFLCSNDQLKNTQKLAAFYNQNLLKDAYNQQHFKTTLSDKLPIYQSSFQDQANQYHHDWALLVAMGYQESHLNAHAISPTGVQGLMMLTNSTAKAMGVSNRVDPTQSISGGARYLKAMKAEFSSVPKTDRLWFALAAYNMGPNAVKRIQSKLEKEGRDKNSWADVFAYLSDHAATNSRYVQCMHYVSNIRSYLESIKTQTT